MSSQQAGHRQEAQAHETGAAGVPFEWRAFIDATCAGLSALTPLPGLDLLLELIFRRRMPRAIARCHAVDLPQETRKQLGRSSEPLLSARGCLLVPLFVIGWLIKRISRKILYILTIKQAAQQLSAYWHRAYLVDHLVRHGHASEQGAHPLVLEAFHLTMREADTDSLQGLARQLVAGVRRVTSVLLRARRKGAGEIMQRQEAFLAGHWAELEAALRQTAAHYERALQAALAELEAAQAPGGAVAQQDQGSGTADGARAGEPGP